MYKDYASLKQFILEGRSKSSRTLEHNTRARLDGDNVIIQFHDTDIMKFFPDGRIILDSGGYKTVTTKLRFNNYLPKGFQLYQDKGLWILSFRFNNDWQNKIEYSFVDGMIINPDHSVIGAGIDQKQLLKLRNQIKKYAKNFMIALASGKVEKPNGGDCWDCYLRNDDGTLGELKNDNDHLLMHFKEKYYVGSLFYRAIELHPVCEFAKHALYELWEIEKLPEHDFTRDILVEQGYKSLLKYLYSQFNLPY